jgi:DNA polymerase
LYHRLVIEARRIGEHLSMAATVSRRDAARALAAVRADARDCRACPLWKEATQTVFGEGPVPAELMIVGEQPGDREDVEGHPFVGPAGRLLDEGLEEAGIDRTKVFVTNVVKHFKWRPSGGGARRIHDKPDWSEVQACLPWFRLELAAVRPRVLVCLGATAAQALLGRSFRVSRERGHPIDSDLAETVFATVHPSAILRAGDRRKQAYAEFVDDLRVVERTLERARLTR